MNTSRFLASTATAVMVAGTIGFAIAQTATPDSTRTQAQQDNARTQAQQQYQSTTPGQTGAATVNPNLDIQRQGRSSSDMSRGTTGDTRTMGNERLARADRN